MSYSWHTEWISRFPKNYREIVIGSHRADVKIHGMVIEFQSAAIMPGEMIERETFYHKMIWVFDARKRDFKWWAIEDRDPNVEHNFYCELRVIGYAWLLDSWCRGKRPTILHLGGNDMIWLHGADPTGGVGVFIQRPILIERFNAGNFSRPQNNLYKPGINLCQESIPKVESVG